MRFRHVAIHVPDLEAAERYYREIFGMETMVREAPQPGDPDRWGQLPRDKGWSDAAAAGVAIGMVAIGGGDVVLALFPGDPSPGQVYAIGLVMTGSDIADVADRLPEDTVLLESQPDWLDFIDRHGLHWQLATSAGFVGSGDAEGRWLEV